MGSYSVISTIMVLIKAVQTRGIQSQWTCPHHITSCRGTLSHQSVCKCYIQQLHLKAVHVAPSNSVQTYFRCCLPSSCHVTWWWRNVGILLPWCGITFKKTEIFSHYCKNLKSQACGFPRPHWFSFKTSQDVNTNCRRPFCNYYCTWTHNDKSSGLSLYH